MKKIELNPDVFIIYQCARFYSTWSLSEWSDTVPECKPYSVKCPLPSANRNRTFLPLNPPKVEECFKSNIPFPFSRDMSFHSEWAEDVPEEPVWECRRPGTLGWRTARQSASHSLTGSSEEWVHAVACTRWCEIHMIAPIFSPFICEMFEEYE